MQAARASVLLASAEVFGHSARLLQKVGWWLKPLKVVLGRKLKPKEKYRNFHAGILVSFLGLSNFDSCGDVGFSWLNSGPLSSNRTVPSTRVLVRNFCRRLDVEVQLEWWILVTLKANSRHLWNLDTCVGFEGHILYINIHQICINICQRLCAPESHENFNDNQICAQSSPKSSFCRSLLHESSPIYSKILRIPKRSQEAYEILSGPRSRHSLEVWRWTAPLHSTGRSFRRGRQVHSLDEITCIGWDHWLFWKDGNMKILQKWKTI
jgi:hypothetical protein